MKIYIDSIIKIKLKLVVHCVVPPSSPFLKSIKQVSVWNLLLLWIGAIHSKFRNPKDILPIY